VDDEPEILKFLEAALVPNGCKVTEVENGEKAISKKKP